MLARGCGRLGGTLGRGCTLARWGGSDPLVGKLSRGEVCWSLGWYIGQRGSRLGRGQYIKRYIGRGGSGLVREGQYAGRYIGQA